MDVIIQIQIEIEIEIEVEMKFHFTSLIQYSIQDHEQGGYRDFSQEPSMTFHGTESREEPASIPRSTHGEDFK